MLPLRRFFNLVYHWGRRNASAEQAQELDDLLTDAGKTDLTAPYAPAAQAEPEHTPGTAPNFKRVPSWWRGNRAAFRSSVAAAQELGEPAAKGVTGVPRATPPTIGRRSAPTPV